MEINWENASSQSPYLSQQRATWRGLNLYRARVMPGTLVEHASDSHEINITLDGSLVTRKSSATGKMISTDGCLGNVCLTPAGQMHGATWQNTLEVIGFLIDPEFLKNTAIENRFSSNFELTEVYKNDDALIKHIGFALLSEAELGSPSGKMFAESLTQTLALHLLKNYSNATFVEENTNGGLSGYKLRRVQEFINERLEDDLSLADLAAVADLSQFHFSRAFRTSTGLTPQKYLMQQRVERAKDLLLRAELPLVEISLRTGFKSQSHFTTLFRKFTKFTPKTWRELKLA